MNKVPVILIADDIAQTIQLVQMSLSSNMECEILTANSGQEALDLTFKHRPDIIILDISLIGLDGYSVCKTINSREGFENIPVIFLSGKSNTQDIVTGLSSGAVDFVTKPFYPKELAARVQIHLKIRRQQQLISEQHQQNRELLQVLCHDLMNPIGALSGILRICHENPEVFGDSSKYLLDSVENMVEMISLVKEMRKIDDNEVEVELEAIDVKEAMYASLQMLEHRFTEKKISSKLCIPEGMKVRAERVSLVNSVLNNLLTNAIKFSYEESEILISGQDIDEEHISLTIEDKGMGIPQEILKDLFSLQVPTSRLGTNNETGTGYGMPLVKKFVTLYGGEVGVESVEKEEGVLQHGTRVILTLNKG